MKTLSLWTLLLPISLLAAGEVDAQGKTVHHPVPAEDLANARMMP